jgi:ribosome biogenesis GTPase
LGWDERVVARWASIDPDASWLPARVVRVERSACVVTLGDHEVVATSPVLPAVGDWVAVARDGDATFVRARVERWSAVARIEQILAANVDVGLITAPADRPSAARVEREIALVWDSGAIPTVVVTKSDLDEGRYASLLSERVVGVDVIETSSVTGIGIGAVSDTLRPCRTAVLIGPSGAGKSTLANALLGDTRFETGAVRETDRRGRHTTTWRELVAVPGGGVLIDTPGLRRLDLSIDGESVAATFPDIEDLATSCRFGDCGHVHEPGCAVRDAVERGTLDAARLASYRKLQREIAFEERRVDPIARANEQRRWKQVHKEAKARTRHRPGHR